MVYRFQLRQLRKFKEALIKPQYFAPLKVGGRISCQITEMGGNSTGKFGVRGLALCLLRAVALH